MAKKREPKLLRCLKKCVHKNDRIAHEFFKGSPEEHTYLESKQHTDDLLDVCFDECRRSRKQRKKK